MITNICYVEDDLSLTEHSPSTHDRYNGLSHHNLPLNNQTRRNYVENLYPDNIAVLLNNYTTSPYRSNIFRFSSFSEISSNHSSNSPKINESKFEKNNKCLIDENKSVRKKFIQVKLDKGKFNKAKRKKFNVKNKQIQKIEPSTSKRNLIKAYGQKCFKQISSKNPNLYYIHLQSNDRNYHKGLGDIDAKQQFRKGEKKYVAKSSILFCEYLNEPFEEIIENLEQSYQWLHLRLMCPLLNDNCLYDFWIRTDVITLIAMEAIAKRFDFSDYTNMKLYVNRTGVYLKKENYLNEYDLIENDILTVFN